MRKYETMFILKTGLEQEVKEKLMNKFKGIIEADGEIEKIDEWGNRKLAYEIDKNVEGYYVVINFKAATDVPKELDRNFKIADQVMRSIIVNVDEK
ncbi:MAG: 30S ribosomal protein S6 [Anaeromicrobium sp.]|jgi:small subunit ribosomal protein S6|uniref:Small ribosomal subunit protein bS6 n=1 Tax=Anaeromicrobium sediminis TaxID=1478221 RepID=A0A267MI43_9FIRM|nr:MULTISPECIES: 30S ribosomal protein S6 [Anaeromicrobium]MCT4595235.1 30S ribosomal protein S6 [Anaeromicrobium sp.]PAB58470.1 30S ribosomal protein S6 [Anaeromicrobium sediminis]